MWNRALENRWPSSLQHVITISSRLCEFCNRHLVQDENCITMLLVGQFAAVAATSLQLQLEPALTMDGRPNYPKGLSLLN